jgi:Na+-transporting methylmalonyl-CoA/oxaloacetate decarboxylase gamma subunit
VIAGSAPVIVGAALVRADEEEFDPNLVTPGVWGFVLTFLIMLVVVLLVLDMVRRIRRVNYRAEVRAQIEAEELEQQFADEGDGSAPDAPGTRPDDGPAAASDDEEQPPAR